MIDVEQKWREAQARTKTMKDYIKRMDKERTELAMKIRKLYEFLYQNPRELDETEKYLMKKQLELMNKYLCILYARADHAVLKGQPK